MIYLHLETVLQAADYLGFHVRDVGLLGSAVSRPSTTVYGSPAYPTLSEAAAAQLESMTGNHPMIDGNNRLAWASHKALLALNGYHPGLSQDEAFELVVGVASGALDMEASARIISQHLRPL